jgi:colanic acid/amylovoran biosynthesis glycosyltransferase
MLVTLLLDRFPMASETFISTGMAGLLGAGCDVTVLARRRPPADEPVHAEVRELGLRERTTYLDEALAPDALTPRSSVPLAPGGADVLHAHFGPNAQRFLFARAQADAPLVVSFHGHDLGADPRIHGAGMYERLWQVADVVTHNCAHARAALEQLGCPAGKVRLLRMPVDVASFPFRARELRAGEPLRLVSVGRLVEKKGHATTLRALARRRAELTPFRLDVIGGGPLEQDLATLARGLGLEGVVTLHGALEGAAVRRLLDEAHVFVLASHTASSGDGEGAPVALAEALACGLPVVSTLHGGIPEVVLDGHSGLLAREADVDALGLALVRMADEHARWPELGAAGRAHVEATFDVGVCTQQLLAIYEDARAAYAAERPPEPAVG